MQSSSPVVFPCTSKNWVTLNVVGQISVLFVAMGMGLRFCRSIAGDRTVKAGIGLAIAMVSTALVWVKPSGADSSLPENPLDLDPTLIENSPTLQRWLDQTPDLLEQNRHDPAFSPTVRLGYSDFPTTNRSSGLGIGVEDWFMGGLPLSISADYHTDFQGQQAGGGNLQYYLLPLGWYVNVTPLVGYRSIQQNDYHSDGINVGGKVVLALSRTGAADIRFSQMFTAPGSANEVGTSTLSVGYALRSHWRLATDLQQQNSLGGKDSRVGLYLEWQP